MGEREKGCRGRWCARLCIKNRSYKQLLKSQLNLMHHLVHTQQISAEEAMECAATIEKVLEGK